MIVASARPQAGNGNGLRETKTGIVATGRTRPSPDVQRFKIDSEGPFFLGPVMSEMHIKNEWRPWQKVSPD